MNGTRHGGGGLTPRGQLNMTGTLSKKKHKPKQVFLLPIYFISELMIIFNTTVSHVNDTVNQIWP